MVHIFLQIFQKPHLPENIYKVKLSLLYPHLLGADLGGGAHFFLCKLSAPEGPPRSVTDVPPSEGRLTSRHYTAVEVIMICLLKMITSSFKITVFMSPKWVLSGGQELAALPSHILLSISISEMRCFGDGLV